MPRSCDLCPRLSPPKCVAARRVADVVAQAFVSRTYLTFMAAARSEVYGAPGSGQAFWCHTWRRRTWRLLMGRVVYESSAAGWTSALRDTEGANATDSGSTG